MRLLKLIAYCIIGYVLYEFYQGLTSEGGRGGGGRRTGGRGRGERSEAESSRGRRTRGQRMTGPSGQGMPVRTEDAAGTAETHRVGRGVVSR
jgi:hypothetical protein